MTIESLASRTVRLNRWRGTENMLDQAEEEARHDALQAVGTILALVEAGTLTVDDPLATFARLAQIEGEVLCLRSLLREPIPGAAPSAPRLVSVAAETHRLVSAAAVGWAGRISVVADTSACVSVTSTELHRILHNVLRNAMRAAGPTGQVNVTVTPDSDAVWIEVEDDGPGFGALPVRHGIGLRSVRRLVQRASGWVEAGGRGRLGGASVRIYLPATGTGSL